MDSVSKKAGLRLGLIAVTAVAGLVLAGCAAGGGDTGDGDNMILVGTTDKVTTLDPAGSYDNGSLGRADAGVPVPGQHRLQQHRGRSRPRRVGRVHLADASTRSPCPAASSGPTATT